MTTPAASKPSTEQFSRILVAKLRQGPVIVQLVSRLLSWILALVFFLFLFLLFFSRANFFNTKSPSSSEECPKWTHWWAFWKDDLTNQAKSRDWDQRCKEYFSCLFPPRTSGAVQCWFADMLWKVYHKEKMCWLFRELTTSLNSHAPQLQNVYASLIALDHWLVWARHQREISYLSWNWMGNEVRQKWLWRWNKGCSL